MRLMRITTAYKAYGERFYESRPGLQEQPYAAQYAAFMDDCYGWADSWTHALGKLGYEVWEPVGNMEPQQKAWAREHGVSYDSGDWMADVLCAQVKHFQPEILFVTDYHTYSRWFIDYLRMVAPSIRVIIGWCGAPYADPDVFNAYDLVLSNIASLVEQFRRQGHRSEQMRHAFNTRILGKIQRARKQEIPFSFVGSVIKRESFHNERERLLSYLVRHSPLRIWSDLEVPPLDEYQRLVEICANYRTLRRLTALPGGRLLASALPRFRRLAGEAEPDLSKYVAFEIAERAERGVYGLAMYQLLRDSKVTLNTHIDISARSASNLRLYEATGVGTCLLTEWMDNLAELFEPDTEVATYRSAEEAAEKANYLLSRDDERRRIAEAGQRRTLRDHTFERRAERLDGIIRRLVNDVGAPTGLQTLKTKGVHQLPADTPLLVVAPSLRETVRIHPALGLPVWGVERSGADEVFVWLGFGKKDGVHATIWSDLALDVCLDARVAAGPARHDQRRTLRFAVQSDASVREQESTFDGDSTLSVRVHLAPGANHLEVTALDTPISRLLNDPRPLLVKLSRLEISSVDR